MMFISVIIFASILFLLSTEESKAIIVVIPVVLIPIVSIVVWIIGALATPVIGLSAFYFKIKNKSPFLGIIIGIGLLILLGIVITLIFKLVNPQRPIY